MGLEKNHLHKDTVLIVRVRVRVREIDTVLWLPAKPKILSSTRAALM